MHYKAPFQLFKKTLSSGTKVYYYTIYDNLNRRRQYSTGCKTKSQARIYCLELFKKDQLTREESKLFSKYTESWFIYDKCPYIKKLLTRGKHYSKSSAVLKRSRLVNKMLPYFKNIKMEDLRPQHIEEWIELLKKEKLSNSTINLYLADIKLILNEAFRSGVISSNPGTRVQNLVNDTKVKHTLKESEVKKLFKSDNICSVWKQEASYYINLIASKTGMRIGEIQALQDKNIKKDHMVVKYSWEINFGLKCPKNGKTRIVPIDNELYDLLKSYIGRSNIHSDFIFPQKDGKTPIDRTNVYSATYKAFKNIGISKEERLKRNITFHSWRHYYNTVLLKRGIPKVITQAIIGHSTDRMTENYTKLTKDDLVNAVINGG